MYGIDRACRATAALAVTVAVTLSCTLLASGTASAAGKCQTTNTWAGNAGVIGAQFGPSGHVQWYVRDFADNGGRWLADVYVGKRRVDHKDQSYQPHGSISPIDLRSGFLLQFVIQHVNTRGEVSFSAPNASCVIP